MSTRSSRNVILLGAAGRDFHDFLVYWKPRRDCRVVAFTAAHVGSMFGFFFQEGPVANFADAARSDSRGPAGSRNTCATPADDPTREPPIAVAPCNVSGHTAPIRQ